eukprot:TRINITY_DN132_c0_g1_i1.p1 TRINITY_DN132_c0_g1~~TRINITY_DN132_c0_g1_i1.p1  ORF type:complete len:664 (+),score=94.86 TRINITY_DN132_c0_g1_i1:197-2188(+)
MQKTSKKDEATSWCGKWYDYIVIGGGTAGCVIAARLTEDPRINVLVIERGQDETDNPQVAVPTQNTVLLTAAYNTLPAQVEFSIEETHYSSPLSTDSYQLIVPWALGGGPAISGSFWGRGDPTNFAEWERLGAQGWGYKDVLPYYKRAESYEQPYYPDVPIDPSRGTNGPIETLALNGRERIIQPLIAALQATSGLPIKVDYNTPAGQLGIAPMQRSTGHDLNKPVRNTTWTKYLKPVLHRRNLTVLPRATLLKINWGIWPWGKKRAVSVEIVNDNKPMRVYIKKELVISAGALNSPRLLLVSGIGPKQHLIDRNVPVVADVPGVGRNLMDHMVFSHAFVMNPSYFANQTDATTPMIQFQASEPSGVVDTELAWSVLPASTTGSVPLLVMYLVGVRNSHRGYVELKNNDTLYRPYLRYNSAEDASDFDKMIQLFRQVKKWFQLLNAQGYALLETGSFASISADASDSEWLALLRSLVSNWWHPAGTCRIGQFESDPLAVVDPRLRLRETLNVRVADNSVQPVVVSTHPSATAIVIGERCAEFIKGDAAALEKEMSLYPNEETEEIETEDEEDTLRPASAHSLSRSVQTSRRWRLLSFYCFLALFAAFSLFYLRTIQFPGDSCAPAYTPDQSSSSSSVYTVVDPPMIVHEASPVAVPTPQFTTM